MNWRLNHSKSRLSCAAVLYIIIFIHWLNLFMKKWIVLGLIGVAFTHFLFGQDALGQWALNYPKAGEVLGDWVKHHPETARVLFEWDGKHPENAQELVHWSIEHKHGTIEGFKDKQPELRGSDILYHHNDTAINEFMSWCSNYAEAAKVLTAQERGLLWVGNHLYSQYLNTGKHGR